jgi:hypothetical protein
VKVLLLILLAVGASAEALAAPCRVDEVTADSRRECLRQAAVSLEEQPEITAENLRRGPHSPLTRASDEDVYCTFMPYNLALKGNAYSPKLFCYHTNRAGQYYNEQGEIVPQAHAVLEDYSRPAQHGTLLDADGQVLRRNSAPQKASILKVKYWSDNAKRNPEILTEVAASRFLWALGFVTDLAYSKTVVCRGCPSDDPYAKGQPNARGEATYTLDICSVDLKPGRFIETKGDQGWGWDLVSGYGKAHGTDFEAYVIALNMLHFHNPRVLRQNALACATGHWDEDGLCHRPIVFVDDLGNTFGGDHIRADYERWKTQRVFEGSGCRLTTKMGSVEIATGAALDNLRKRLTDIDETAVNAIFESTRFDEERTGASTDAWTRSMLERIAEVRSASCP